ncbi:MAG: glutaredoxin family protein [Nocardioidaceae bacterium]|nr:glutaredoxin family protein [Nocardioidaceae bacterium]
MTGNAGPGAGPGQTELGETPPRVVLYSKPGCHLCDDAREVIAAVCAELGETFDEVDITTSDELMREFGEQIPVTFVDGDQHDFWRVDAGRLRAALV